MSSRKPRGKERLDVRLVRDGLVDSRERAQSFIRAGRVRVNGHTSDKPGRLIPDGAQVEVLGPDHPYASRGGVKLEGALEGLDVRVEGVVGADFGASTGGFTDCLLQRGCRRVYAFDVGYGQLAWRLQTDPRVVVRDRTNVRYLTASDLPEPVDVVTADLSFISLTKVLGAAWHILRPGGLVIALVKPQFELGPHDVGKGGIVRSVALRRQAVNAVAQAAGELGFAALGRAPSVLPGRGGNVEVFLLLQKPL